MDMPAACATDVRSRFDASTAPPDQTARPMLVHGGCGQRGGGAYLDGSLGGDGRRLRLDAQPERATGQTRTTGRACGPEPSGQRGGAIPDSRSSREHQIIQTGDHSASRRLPWPPPPLRLISACPSSGHVASLG